MWEWKHNEFLNIYFLLDFYYRIIIELKLPLREFDPCNGSFIMLSLIER